MIILYIILGIIYLFFLCLVIKLLYDDYKKKKPIPLVPKGWDKFLYLFFPAYVPFYLLSSYRIHSNKKIYKTYRESVLTELFDGDSSRLKEFEETISSRCDVFDVSFYLVLNRIPSLEEEGKTSRNIYSLVNRLVQENDLKIDEDDIPHVAYELLSCYYRNKYDESDTQRIIRLRKAGYNVRSTQLGRDEEKHTVRCDYEGHEKDCPKNCDSCIISLKTDADLCLLKKDFKGAIEKYQMVLQKEPNFAEAWNNMASSYGSLGEHTSALNAYLKAIDIDPMYGKALWGAAVSLGNLGRKGESMTLLNELLKYYDFKDAASTVEELKKQGVKPITVNRDLESSCYKQISLIASNFGLTPYEDSDMSFGTKSMFEDIFNPFFDYLVSYYDKIDKTKLSIVTSKFMLLAGMASSKFQNCENDKVMAEGIVKLLSSPKGFFAMDEYCCDYLGIPYIPDKENALSPCIGRMAQEANRIYSDIIHQVKSVSQIKYLVHDISCSFYRFGFNFIDYKYKNSLPIEIHPKSLTLREELALRLKTMANDPTMKTEDEERSRGAMCYSISIPDPVAYMCDHCGNVFHAMPENEVVRYYKEISKMGYDCKLEHWCRECCEKNEFAISDYSKSGFIFYIKLDSNEQYRKTLVSSFDLQILYQFFKNENKIPYRRDAFYVGKAYRVIENLLGIKIDE